MFSDPTQIQNVTRNVIFRCRRLAVVSKSVLETSDDAMYRSLIKLYVTQLNKSKCRKIWTYPVKYFYRNEILSRTAHMYWN